jgi:hypothetical protein
VVVTGGERNVVRDSVVSGGRSEAITVARSDRMRILDNTVRGGFSGAIVIASNEGLVAGNTTYRGISMGGSNSRLLRNRVDSGRIETYGIDNVVAHNLVLDAGSQVGTGPGLSVSGAGTVVTDNAVSGAQFDGIWVAAGATGTILRRNVSTNNFDDGIEVQSPSTRMFRNTADDNGDLGVEAVPGVFAVGNRAHGNGNPLQCLNIACR